jgi:ABC-type antimicrobial peptide transport system permease subunit
VFQHAELNGFADAQMDEAFIQKVKSLDGMQELSATYVLNDTVFCDGQSLGRVEATDDLNLFNRLFAVHYDTAKTQQEIENSFNTSRNILLSTDSLQTKHAKIGDIISLTSGGKTYDYTIIGSYSSRANGSQALIPSSYAMSNFGASSYGLLAFKAVNPNATMSIIRDLFGNKPNWSRTVEEFNSDAASVIGAFLAPMHKMTYFIFMLATVGIINNLIINYIQKKRLIAVYKSVGLSNHQNVKMTLLEGFSSGLIGVTIGILVSILEIKTIFLVAGPKISIKPELNAWIFIMAAIVGIATILIGSLVPILKSSQMKIVEEIKFE